MRKFRCLISGAMALSIAYASAGTDLPRVIILGKPYYCYEAKKGDSLFGISQRFGWDNAIVSELNPNVGSPIDKGTLIYYPAEQTADVAEKKEDAGYMTDRVVHTVQSGETIYSISRAYDIPMERLYALNPHARQGVRTGEVLVISEGESIEKPAPTADDLPDVSEEPGAHERYVYHNLAEGEDLYTVARRYNTRIEDIYRANPGLSPDHAVEGTTVRVLPGTREENVRYETSTEERLVSVETYKVRKGDTWASVARKLGVDEQLLRESNPGKWKLRKDDMLTVPKTQEVQVELAYHEEDPREQTPEGLRELYEEVHDMDPVSQGDSAEKRREVRVAIVLDDTSSNRDMEFSRGALLAVDRLKNAPFKTAVTVIDGSDPMSKVLTGLETFRPDLIISTSDKALPQYLSEYASRTHVELVNTFDMKSEEYITNPDVFQFLTPSSYFNDAVRDYVAGRFDGFNLIIAGEPGSSDPLLESIKSSFASKGVTNVASEELPDFSIDQFGKYIIYGTPVKKDDISALLENVIRLKEDNPTAQIVVLGRPNWITVTESLSSKLKDASAMVPSRFYFNATDPLNRAFIDDYNELYGQTPVKSYPVYAVAGYDLITYFLPNISMTEGDFNATFNRKGTLQTEISLERVSNWGGMYNPNCYIIEFAPYSEPEKIILPK